MPKPPKKPATTQPSSSHTTKSNAAASKPLDKQLEKKKITPKDHTIDRLEALHKITNVENNLKLPPGQRLKLEPSSELKRKRKEPRIIDTDIAFADLKDPNASPPRPQDLSNSDDDDLPEAHEILNASTARKRVSSDDFPDSELDDLIRGLPSDGLFFTRLPQSPIPNKSQLSLSPATPPPKRMRLNENVEVMDIPRKVN